MNLLKDLRTFIENLDEEKFLRDVERDEDRTSPFDWTGLKHRPESIEKMRQAKLGKKFSKKTRLLLKKQRQNKMWITDGVNDFWVDNDLTIPENKWRGRSTAKKRAPMSEEQKEKLRQARLGTKHSEETKRKMGLSRLGNQNARKKPLNT